MKKENTSPFLIIIKNCSFIIATIVLSIIFFNSCNQCGCTDPVAINYNSAADKQDGSCEYCDSTIKYFESKTITVKDLNIAGPHYNQVVAKFILDHDSLKYNNQSCKGNTCRIFLHIESEVNQEMEFTYFVSSSYPLYLSSSHHIIIPGNTTYNADTVNFNGNSPCGNMNNSNIIVTLVDGYIVYH